MEQLPDSLLLRIFDCLDYQDVVFVSQCCRKFHRIAGDEILWGNLFHRHFNLLPKKFKCHRGASSWKLEFARLIDEIPIVETEVLTKHTHPVFHVSFSHDGKRFATTGEGAFVHVWKSGYPVEHEYSENMDTFSWVQTNFSQFNDLDELLLVSGGSLDVAYEVVGEIAVFSLTNGFQLQHSALNMPVDIDGTWFSEMVFLSGYYDYSNDGTVISLNNVSQKAESEHTVVTMEMYRFLCNITCLTVANCVELASSMNKKSGGQNWIEARVSNPLSERELANRGVDNSTSHVSRNNGFDVVHSNESCLEVLLSERDEWRSADLQYANIMVSGSLPATEIDSTVHSDEETVAVMEQHFTENIKLSSANKRSECHATDETKNEFVDTGSKLLILTMDRHQLGFKKITLSERVKEWDEMGEQDVQLNPLSDMKTPDGFDKVDKIIDFHSNILGTTLSPDHRYLYVNTNPRPENFEINEGRDTPPMEAEVDLHVIDMATLTQAGMMEKAHCVRTATPCFLLYLDCSELYLASTAENNHGYVWDRNYGIALAKLPHGDVVNAVAFNPQNPEMLVTVSKDATIKIWRSRRFCRKLGINVSAQKLGTKLYEM